MLEVEIIAIEDSLILRARGSELLILPNHVVELKKAAQPKEFVAYFLHEALVNRSARKLLEAWLRKDHTLWKRVHQKVQEIEITEKTKKVQSEVKPAAITVPAHPKASDLKGEVIKPTKEDAKKSHTKAQPDPALELKKPDKKAEMIKHDKKPSSKKEPVEKKPTKKESVEKTTKKVAVEKKPAAKTTKSKSASTPKKK